MTKRRSQTAASVLILLVAPTYVSAKAWRDIKPLHSRIEDTVKHSQSCAGSKRRCQFSTGNEDVMITFSDEQDECDRVATGTVLAVIVKLVRPRKMTEFKIQKHEVETFDPSTPEGAGYKAYYKVKEGLIINTFKGEVIQLVYLPTKPELRRCSDYYSNPKAFVQVGLIY